MTIAIKIGENGCDFFWGTPDQVSAELARLQSLSAEKLGYKRDEDEEISGVEVIYDIHPDVMAMKGASAEDLARAERAADEIGRVVTFFAQFSKASA